MSAPAGVVCLTEPRWSKAVNEAPDACATAVVANCPRTTVNVFPLTARMTRISESISTRSPATRFAELFTLNVVAVFEIPADKVGKAVVATDPMAGLVLDPTRATLNVGPPLLARTGAPADVCKMLDVVPPIKFPL